MARVSFPGILKVGEKVRKLNLPLK